MDAAAPRAARFTQPAIPITNGRLLPFSGQIEKVSAKNIHAKSLDVRPQAIYCLTEGRLPDVYFFGCQWDPDLAEGISLAPVHATHERASPVCDGHA
jgi:hypothetical protein